MNIGQKALFAALILILLFVVAAIGLSSALLPLVFSFFLAYLSFPLILKIEHKGLPRHFAVSIVFLMLILLFVGLSFAVVPGIVSDVQVFFRELPHNVSLVMVKLESLAVASGYDIDFSRDGLKDIVLSNISTISKGFVGALSKLLRGTFSNVFVVFAFLANFFLAPLFYFYCITDYEKISAEFKSFFSGSGALKLEKYSKLTNTVLSGYVRGQLMVAIALAVLYGVGLPLVGLKFGLLIGIMTGLLNVIPYVGFSLGLLATLLVILSNPVSTVTIIGVVIVFAVVQTLESFIITPKLVGNKVGLSSFSTMLVLIIGGNLLGLFGMLVAIPVAAILKAFVADLKQELHA